MSTADQSDTEGSTEGSTEEKDKRDGDYECHFGTGLRRLWCREFKGGGSGWFNACDQVRQMCLLRFYVLTNYVDMTKYWQRFDRHRAFAY